jgi:hypothetical protein
MSRPVEEIGVAESDVTRPSLDKRANILQNDLARHGEKPAVINGRNRAMRAVMQTPAARFDVSGQSLFAFETEARVTIEMRKTYSIRRGEIQSLKHGE